MYEQDTPSDNQVNNEIVIIRVGEESCLDLGPVSLSFVGQLGERGNWSPTEQSCPPPAKPHHLPLPNLHLILATLHHHQSDSWPHLSWTCILVFIPHELSEVSIRSSFTASRTDTDYSTRILQWSKSLVFSDLRLLSSTSLMSRCCSLHHYAPRHHHHHHRQAQRPHHTTTFSATTWIRTTTLKFD